MPSLPPLLPHRQRGVFHGAGFPPRGRAERWPCPQSQSLSGIRTEITDIARRGTDGRAPRSPVWWAYAGEQKAPRGLQRTKAQAFDSACGTGDGPSALCRTGARRRTRHARGVWCGFCRVHPRLALTLGLLGALPLRAARAVWATWTVKRLGFLTGELVVSVRVHAFKVLGGTGEELLAGDTLTLVRHLRRCRRLACARSRAVFGGACAGCGRARRGMVVSRRARGSGPAGGGSGSHTRCDEKFFHGVS